MKHAITLAIALTAAPAHADVTADMVVDVIAGMHRYHIDEATESDAEFRRRIRPVGEAIAEQCDGRSLDCAANLITIGRAESAWAGFVGRGCLDLPPKHPLACDRAYHGGPPRALTYWQLWRVACAHMPVNPHDLPPGPAQIRAAVACADSRLRSSAYRCRGQNEYGILGGIFAGYRSVDCAWLGGKNGVVRRIFIRGIVMQSLRAQGR